MLCITAQEKFDQFFEIRTVPRNQLYGGKIIAALDRQHPRDIFDTMRLLDKESLDEEIVRGFLFCLLSSSKPMHLKSLSGQHLHFLRSIAENKPDWIFGNWSNFSRD